MKGILITFYISNKSYFNFALYDILLCTLAYSVIWLAIVRELGYMRH